MKHSQRCSLAFFVTIVSVFTIGFTFKSKVLTGKWKTADIKENQMQSVRRMTMEFDEDGLFEMQVVGEPPQKGTYKQSGKDLVVSLPHDHGEDMIEMVVVSLDSKRLVLKVKNPGETNCG